MKGMVRTVAFGIFLSVAAWQDLRRREIAVWVFLAFGAAGLLLIVIEGSARCCFYGSAVGGILLLAGVLSKGAIGMGDGCFFTVSGLFLGLSANIRLLCFSLLLSGIYSLGIYVYKRVRYGIYAGKETLPFLPFVAAGELLLLAAYGR